MTKPPYCGLRMSFGRWPTLPRTQRKNRPIRTKSGNKSDDEINHYKKILKTLVIM